MVKVNAWIILRRQEKTNNVYAKGHGIKALLLFFGHGTVINNFIHSFAKKLWYLSHVFKKAYAVRILIHFQK